MKYFPHTSVFLDLTFHKQFQLKLSTKIAWLEGKFEFSKLLSFFTEKFLSENTILQLVVQ